MNETQLSCYLKSQSKVRKFANLILWHMIKNLIEYFSNNKKSIRKPVSRKVGSRKFITPLSKENKAYILVLLTEKYKDTNQIEKPGLSLNMANKVISYVNRNDIKSYDTLLEDERYFHKIMGCIYGFLDGTRVNKKRDEVFFYTIDKNEKLKKLVLSKIKELFFLPDIHWETVKNYVGENKTMISDMIFNVTTCPISSYRRNLSRVPYIRFQNTNLDLTAFPKEIVDEMLVNVKKDKKNCHKDFTSNRNGLLISSKYHYNLEGTFFKTIMNHYNKDAIGGPSGSIVILYDIIFKFLEIENNKQNQLLLLAIAISDYVPYYHTVDEILMAYMNEININYTIDKNPVEFTVRLLKKYKII